MKYQHSPTCYYAQPFHFTYCKIYLCLCLHINLFKYKYFCLIGINMYLNDFAPVFVQLDLRFFCYGQIVWSSKLNDRSIAPYCSRSCEMETISSIEPKSSCECFRFLLCVVCIDLAIRLRIIIEQRKHVERTHTHTNIEPANISLLRSIISILVYVSFRLSFCYYRFVICVFWVISWA